ncbi:unnamed protein product [Ilex paraguariensis]|uniref:Uncharacterized protein n=1 Tax=Ilex paraguariensis TaxID=185542 RepID=A0ABC8SUT9_9AQUA
MYGGKNDREWQIVKGKSVVPRKGSVLKSSPKREARRGEVSLSRLEDPRQSERERNDNAQQKQSIIAEKDNVSSGNEGDLSKKSNELEGEAVELRKLLKIAEKVVEEGNVFDTDYMVGGVVSEGVPCVSSGLANDSLIQNVEVGSLDPQWDKTGSLNRTQIVNRGLALVSDLNMVRGQEDFQEGIYGNVRGGNEHCGFNKLISLSGISFCVERFATRSGASVTLNDDRGLFRNREPPGKGYCSDTESTMRSKEMMQRVVANSEGSDDSNAVSIEFSSAEVENRPRLGGNDLSVLHD